MVKIFWDVLMSPQVKRRAVISNKFGISKLSNDVRLSMLGYWEMLRKSENFLELKPCPQP